MNTQSTPVHIRLWHHDFWRMSVANLLLSASVYMLIPVMPLWMIDDGDYSFSEVGLAMGIFAFGLYVLGPFCSYLVQHYRRNVVCMISVAAVILSFAMLYYEHEISAGVLGKSVVVLSRIVMGAAYGLAQMTLSSTLIIDISESAQRTEACYSAAWFSRFALSLGPIAALILYHYADFRSVLIASAACAASAIILIRLVEFPFRTPEEDIPVVSLDRFFLTHGSVIFATLAIVMCAIGLLMSLPLDVLFYNMLMAGFLLSVLAQRFVFRNAEMKSEAVSSLIMIGLAILIQMTRRELDIVNYAVPLMIGVGLGTIGSRFLLFFIKLSRHCQRGTSQSTYMLGWESGLSLGLALGYGLFAGKEQPILVTSLVLIVLSLAVYHLYVHSWFVRNKNR